jgi:hypothetical protein
LLKAARTKRRGGSSRATASIAKISWLRVSGNTKSATAYYARFVDLWKDCDPELRPQVDEARARLAALGGR